MSPEFREDELLALSGIQHFFYCRRQWALIHIEKQWKDNEKTIEGKLIHDRVDDPLFNESRPGLLIARAMPVLSYELGLYGICDVVEFKSSANGTRLHGQEGKFLPMPIEYKRGKEKSDQRDEVQLCAQAICLEEMLSIQITKACFFYASSRRRVEIPLSDDLRRTVKTISLEMHDYFARGFTPRVKRRKSCNYCSLKEICLPEMTNRNLTVNAYIRSHLDEF
jgi:CRISPR-associated exonuclease Cas4